MSLRVRPLAEETAAAGSADSSPRRRSSGTLALMGRELEDEPDPQLLAAALHERRLSYEAIGRELGISRSTAHEWCRRVAA